MTDPYRSDLHSIPKGVSIEAAKKACMDKGRYPNKNRARDAITKIAKRFPDKPPVRPYRCSICGGWHLTTKVPYGLARRPKNARAA